MKISVSLPETVIVKADKRAEQLGVSRSAFIAMSISEKIRQDEAVECLPEMLSAMSKLSVKVGE